jgi:hypothetical protein
MTEKGDNARQKETLIDRRNFLKLGGSGLATALMPFPASALTPREMQSHVKVTVESDTSFRLETIQRILGENKKAKDLTGEELGEIAKLCQHTFTQLMGTTYQEEMRNRYGPRYHRDFEVFISKHPTFPQPGAGFFAHSRDRDIPNRVYLSETMDARKMIQHMFHELSHGALGRGEVRAEFLSGLAHLYMQSKIFDRTGHQLSGNHAEHFLWDPAKREGFLQSGRYTEAHKLYVWLPVLAFAEFRASRESGEVQTIREFVDTLSMESDALMQGDFDDRALRNGLYQADLLRPLVSSYLRECAHQFLQFNPKARLPDALSTGS